MIPIHGQYIKENKEVAFAAEIPSTWEELNAHQYATIVEVLSFSKADRFTIAVSLLTLLFETKNYHILYYSDESDLHSLTVLINFIIEGKLPVKNFFPSLNIKKKIHYAPSESLGEINFGEWCFAYQAWEYYTKFKDVASLNELVAILYRQKSEDPEALEKTGDSREPFNENVISQRAKSVAHIGLKFKLAVYGWFTAAITDQMSQRPTAFPIGDGESESEAESETPSTIFTLFRELLGVKWGTTNNLRLENAGFVLDGLEEQRIHFKKSAANAGA